MKRCLVVDDSSVIRKVAGTILETMEYEMVEAEHGQVALDRCRAAAQPDVIILDWHMPGLSTLEFLSQLRAAPNGKHPYVIYLTTEYDQNDIARVMAAGADDYLMKPFDRAQFVTKLAEINVAA